MTDFEQIVAIAKTSGWEWWNCPSSQFQADRWGQLRRIRDAPLSGWYRGTHTFAPSEGWPQSYVDDFLHDINAIQKAVLSQGAAFQSKFDFVLRWKADRTQRFVHQLSARCWAYCFLVASGKWTDSAPPNKPCPMCGETMATDGRRVWCNGDQCGYGD